mgnify:FL=1
MEMPLIPLQTKNFFPTRDSGKLSRFPTGWCVVRMFHRISTWIPQNKWIFLRLLQPAFFYFLLLMLVVISFTFSA